MGEFLLKYRNFSKFSAPAAPKIGHWTQFFPKISKRSHFSAPSAPKKWSPNGQSHLPFGGSPPNAIPGVVLWVKKPILCCWDPPGVVPPQIPLVHIIQSFQTTICVKQSMQQRRTTHKILWGLNIPNFRKICKVAYLSPRKCLFRLLASKVLGWRL